MGFLRLGWAGSFNTRFNTNLVNVPTADQTCYTKNLTTDSNNVFFGTTVSNKFHVFNTLDALQFAVNKGQVYLLHLNLSLWVFQKIKCVPFAPFPLTNV